MESRPPYGGDSQRLGVRYGSKADPSVANADVHFGSKAAVLRLAAAREAGRVKAKQCASSRSFAAKLRRLLFTERRGRWRCRS
jgi:hypothetical protein